MMQIENVRVVEQDGWYMRMLDSEGAVMANCEDSSSHIQNTEF